jgi:hypothetical protein
VWWGRIGGPFRDDSKENSVLIMRSMLTYLELTILGACELLVVGSVDVRKSGEVFR